LSKESKNKKKQRNAANTGTTGQPPSTRPKLSNEEKARIVRDSLAKRPVIMFRYPNGKLNKKFLIGLAALIVALVASLYFVTR
jgi:hypothetical protein